jgi:hypothetical protein
MYNQSRLYCNIVITNYYCTLISCYMFCRVKNTVPTEHNLTESEPIADPARSLCDRSGFARADPERTQSELRADTAQCVRSVIALGSLGRTQSERRANTERNQSEPRGGPERTLQADADIYWQTQQAVAGALLRNITVYQSCCKLIG